MKFYLSILLIVLTLGSFARQPDTAQTVVTSVHSGHRPTLVNLGVGFGDYYKINPTFSMPSGFRAGNTTGFAPLSLRLEYGLNMHFALAGSMYIDRFQYNYAQLYSGGNVKFSRYLTNSFSLFGGGLTAVYYPTLNVKIPNVEPFIQVGLSLNNIQQSAVPQGDSTASSTTHRTSPVLKIGGRYYCSKERNAGFYLELGYNRQSVLNIGFSARLTRKKGRHLRL